MIVLLVAMVGIVAAAGLVLVAVAYPYRGRAPGVAPGLTAWLGHLVRRLRPHDPNPDYAILTGREQDARMRRRLERVERGVTGRTWGSSQG